MSKFIDLTGQKFNRLTVLKRIESKQTKWLCECDCENRTQLVVFGGNLKKGHTKSCGCLRTEEFTIHGHSTSSFYKLYYGIKDRCYNSNNPNYKHYGGRGIIICDEWLNDFMSFYSWAMANGYKDGLSIDRINVDGNYEPSNCKWATQKEQVNNTRRNVLLEINGEVKNITQWTEEYNLKRGVIKRRLELGWQGEDLVKPTEVKKAEFQSGVKNITWDRNYNKWSVALQENGKNKRIGYFLELDDAIKAKESYINNQIKET
jgi:hypothetical protein